MAGKLKTDYPEISMIARVSVQFPSVRRGDLEIPEAIYFADPDFFRIMPFTSHSRRCETALDAPDAP